MNTKTVYLLVCNFLFYFIICGVCFSSEPDRQSCGESYIRLQNDYSRMISFFYNNGEHLDFDKQNKYFEDFTIKFMKKYRACNLHYEMNLLASDIFTGLGEINSALDFAKRAVKLNEEKPSGHHTLAMIYESLKDYDKASFHYEKSISKGNIFSMYNYCNFLSWYDNVKAIDLCTKVINDDRLEKEQEPWAILARAMAYKGIGNLERYNKDLKLLKEKGYRYSPATGGLLKIKRERQLR